MLNLSKRNEPLPMLATVAYVVVISVAVDAALLLSMAGKLSWIYSTVVAFSAAILAVGILFTALELFTLNRSHRS